MKKGKVKIKTKEKIGSLSISTLNIQGINVPLKRQLIFECMHNEDLNIVSVTKKNWHKRKI